MVARDLKRKTIMEDEDVEWERWMALSEEEQEAEIRAAVTAYERRWRAMTPGEQYRHLRAMAVSSCAIWRRLEREFSFAKEYRVAAQRRLRTLREEWR